MIWKKIKEISTVLILATTVIGTSTAAYAAEIPDRLIPVGDAIGISIKTKGVIVSEISELETSNGKVSPAKDAGILPGDIITMINGEEINCAEDIDKILSNSGKTVTMQIIRDGDEMQLTLEPYSDGKDSFIGVWLRDSMSGIGTITYYDPDTNSFGALGHSISDPVTGLIIPLQDGNIMPAQITGVTKGHAGAPGQLGGVFKFDNICGKIDKNCQAGIFGVIIEKYNGELGEAIPVASEDEIQVGSAVILSSASGQVEEYDIEVTRLYHDNSSCRSMMIKVTDQDLIDITGGIVQGMSGSPIIQNGKLIGAVTHVLINNPEKGYGVSIEDMLENAA